MKSVKLFFAVLVLAAGAPDRTAAADGAKVWKKCVACHVYDSDKKKTGPSLWGLIGRACGAVDKYKYGKGYKQACADNAWSWDDAALDEYLADPRKFIKVRSSGKSKMMFKLKKADDRAAVIDFLKANATK